MSFCPYESKPLSVMSKHVYRFPLSITIPFYPRHTALIFTRVLAQNCKQELIYKVTSNIPRYWGDVLKVFINDA
ncbi:hypothetical protein ACTXT7_004347 [Hymenolepis weldensis]